MDLYGNPTLQGAVPSLQGGGVSLQGSTPALQPAGNPQPATGLYGPPAPVVAPAPAPVKTVVRTPSIGTPASIQVAQPDSQINSIFAPHIGSRPSASNPGVLEYYNKQTGQGFSSAQDLYNFASTLGAGPVNSFDQLHAPVGSYQGAVQNASLYSDPNQGIAQNAGTAGLSLDDYIKLIQQQNQITPDQLAQIQQGLGIPGLAQQAFAPPQTSTVDFYNQLYGQAGLADVKSKILDLNNQVEKAKADYLTATGNVNENPWLSEASRVGRVSRLDTQAQQEINNLLSEQQQYQTIYQNGLGEINNVVQQHTQDFTTQQTLNAQKLTYLLSQAEAQKTALQAQEQQSAYQYLPAYLQAKAKATTPATVTAPNGAVFSYDKASGTYQQLVGPGGNYQQNTITGDLYSQNTGQTLGAGSTGAGSVSIPQGTLAAQNNNPGNLRFVGQPGATQGAGGFAKFDTPEAGYQAYLSQVQLDASRGLTLGQFITKYAPPSENNTAQYIQQATTALGVSASTPLSQINPNQLAAFQLKKESGTTLSAGSQGSVSSNVIETTAQGLVDGTINPNQLSPRAPGYLQILQRANDLSQQQTGKPFDASQAEINYNARQQGLNQNATTFRDIANHQQVALDHLAELQALADKVGFSEFPVQNDARIWTSDHLISDGNIKNLQSNIGIIRGEVAAVLGGGTPTDSSRATAEQVLPFNIPPSQLQETIQHVKDLMAEKIKAISRTDNIPQFGGTTGSNSSNVDLSGLNFSF